MSNKKRDLQIRLFATSNDDEGLTKQMAEMSESTIDDLIALKAELDSRSQAYSRSIKGLDEVGKELDSIKDDVERGKDLGGAVKRLAVLIGAASEGSKETKPRPQSDGKVQQEVNSLSSEVKNQLAANTPGGGEKMPKGDLSISDIIRLAVDKSAADDNVPPSPPMAMPAPPSPAPGNAAPMPSDTTPSETPFLRLKGIYSTIGSDTSKDKDTIMGGVNIALSTVSHLVQTGLDSYGLLDEAQGPVVPLRTKADKIRGEAITVNKALIKAIDALRDFVDTVKDTHLAESTSSFAAAVKGLKDHLAGEWPKEENVEPSEEQQDRSQEVLDPGSDNQNGSTGSEGGAQQGGSQPPQQPQPSNQQLPLAASDKGRHKRG